MNRKLLLIISGSILLLALGVLMGVNYAEQLKTVKFAEPGREIPPTEPIGVPVITLIPKVKKIPYPQLTNYENPTKEDMKKWKAYTDELSKRFGPDWVVPKKPIPPTSPLPDLSSPSQSP